MKRYREDGKEEDFLTKYPAYRKWINQCSCCNRMGYKPEMPEVINGPTGEESLRGRTIRKCYKPLAVNDDGLCGVCAKLVAKPSKQ